MKKISTFIIMLAVCLTACQNRLHVNGIDNAVKEAFYNRYPKAWDVEWEQEAGNTIVMDFKDGLYEKEAWYLSDGTWLKTRTELPLFDVPKVVIDATLSALGTGWYIEEAELWETSSTPAEYYLLDCEKVVSRQETVIMVLPDGTVFETPETGTPGTENPGTENPGTDNPGTGTPGTDNPGSVTPGNGDYFAAAKLTFAAMYPNAVNVEWEMEYGKLNAEFYQDRYEKEAWFLTDGTWLFTETELPVNEVPAALAEIILAKLGSGWYIDDAEHYTSSSEPKEYYILECENKFSDSEAKLRITPDGTIL